MSAPLDRACAAFAAAFGGAPRVVGHAPGRVNLIGEHTDYNDGFVLPCAIEGRTYVAARGRADRLVCVVAADQGGETDAFALDTPIGHAAVGWADYIRGVLEVMQARLGPLPGMDLVVAGDVPQGAGLSSSAALEVAVARAAGALAGARLDATEVALLAQRAENDFVGCACGIMDQLISSAAQEGCASLIDCRSLALAPVRLPEAAAVLVVHSGVQRGLVGSAYNERRRQCREAAEALGVPALRDADLAGLEAARSRLDPVVFRRARHIVTENARTTAMAAALAVGELGAAGELMAASHASMRDDFEITTPAVDALAALAHAAVAGEGGARMTGGGFGGCVVVVGAHEAVARTSAEAARSYRTPAGEPPFQFICRPAAGAGVL